MIDPFRFAREVLFGITAGIMIAVITEVGPVCRNETGMTLQHIVNTEGSMMPLQNFEYVRAEPPLVTKLYGKTEAPRRGS